VVADRNFSWKGTLADGKVLIRDMETDLVYVGTLFESFR
jgi:hypothetical protein